VHCVSPHQRFHKPHRISTLETKNIILCVYLLDHNLSYEYGSSIQGRSQDGAKVEDFKYLSKGKIFLVPTLSLSPICPRTSKRLSMGEEVGTMPFSVQGEQIKMMKEKRKREKMSITKRKRDINEKRKTI
jgi:hypothetical protein